MRLTLSLIISAIFLFLCFSPTKVTAGSQVQISESFVKIYETLDPKSTVLKLGKKGDQYTLVYAGETWYQVDIGGKVGWIERKAGTIIDNPSAFSPGMSIALVTIVLIGIIIAIAFYQKKQRAE